MIVRWHSLNQMDSLRRQIDEVFSDLADSSTQSEQFWWPAIELIDTPDSFQLQALLPGINRESIDIQATRNAVLMVGERPYQSHDDYTCLRSEFPYGKFRRLIELPVEINPEQIQADFHNGLLNLTVPKAEHARRRVVKVQVNELAGQSQQKALDVASEEVAQT